jgi:glycine oxidase
LATPDVTVRGAGVFGLTVAFVCLERGARVRMIDPGGPGAGASGGIVGALAPHVPDNWNAKKAFQLDCLRTGADRWARVEAVSGVATGYGRTGRIQPLPDQRATDLARERAGDAARHWGDAYRWEVVTAEEAAGWGPVSPTELCLVDTLTARIHPRRACRSLAAAITTLGGEICRDGDERGAVVHATGWTGLRELSEAFGKPVGSGVKGQAVLLRHAAPEGAAQIFADGLHIVPHADGTVAVGSTSEREFDDPRATVSATGDLIDRAVAAMPILHGAAVVERWAGVRPRARSRAPLVGPWPDRPGHFIANGGFKIGFGLTWGVADLVADLVLEDRDRVPEEFRPEASI